MKFSAASVAALAGAASAADFVTTLPGTFEIEVVNVTSVAKRAQPLVLTLTDGVLRDELNRFGYIASNEQFQFDNPVQPNAKTNGSGWSAFNNGTLALNGNAIFDSCLSGGFYNLYGASIGGQCTPIFFGIINRSAQAVSQIPDGQVTGTPVSQITDGQPQATTGVPVTQITDGQPQAPTGNPITQLTDGQPQAPTGTPVTQISDGQPQAPTGTPITQISDGQPQAPVATSGRISMKPSKIGTSGTIGSMKPTSTLAPFTGAAMPTAVRGEFFGLAAGVLAAALL